MPGGWGECWVGSVNRGWGGCWVGSVNGGWAGCWFGSLNGDCCYQGGESWGEKNQRPMALCASRLKLALVIILIQLPF